MAKVKLLAPETMETDKKPTCNRERLSQGHRAAGGPCALQLQVKMH